NRFAIALLAAERALDPRHPDGICLVLAIPHLCGILHLKFHMASNRRYPVPGTDKSLSKQVLEWRRSLGWTQGDLERKAGLAHNAISRIEQEEVSPRLETVEKIAAAMSISVEQLQYKAPVQAVEEAAADYGSGSIDAEISRLPEPLQHR